MSSAASGPTSPLAGLGSSRRYQSSTPGYATQASMASRRRRRRLLILLGSVALLTVLTVVIVPPSVVLTTRNNAAKGDPVAALTTVIDGKTTTITQSGVLVTRSRLSTLADGQVSTLTSVVTIPNVTVSATNVDRVQTAYVTTTLTDGLVAVVRTATRLQTDVATVTLTTSDDDRRYPRCANHHLDKLKTRHGGRPYRDVVKCFKWFSDGLLYLSVDHSHDAANHGQQHGGIVVFTAVYSAELFLLSPARRIHHVSILCSDVLSEHECHDAVCWFDKLDYDRVTESVHFDQRNDIRIKLELRLLHDHGDFFLDYQRSADSVDYQRTADSVDYRGRDFKHLFSARDFESLFAHNINRRRLYYDDSKRVQLAHRFADFLARAGCIVVVVVLQLKLKRRQSIHELNPATDGNDDVTSLLDHSV
ncbi:hypothetical protein JCM3774_005994 [Rhodotorula dairenensis]